MRTDSGFTGTDSGFTSTDSDLAWGSLVDGAETEAEAGVVTEVSGGAAVKTRSSDQPPSINRT